MVLLGTMATLISLIFAACYIENKVPAEKGEPWGYPDSFNGRIEGSAQGHSGPVRVTITMTDGIITIVDFDIRFETDAFAGRLPDLLRPIILRTNTFNFPDRTAGATATSMAIKEAARRALSEYPNGPKIPREELGF